MELTLWVVAALGAIVNFAIGCKIVRMLVKDRFPSEYTRPPYEVNSNSQGDD